MIILGIDASTHDTGWGVLDDDNLIGYGSIVPPDTDLPEKLLYVYDELKRVIVEYNPDIVACEDQYLGKNTNTVKTLSQLKGVINLLCQQHGLFIKYYYPTTIKKAATGDGKADKKMIIDAINKRYSTDIQNDNITDAIAIAFTLKEVIN